MNPTPRPALLASRAALRKFTSILQPPMPLTERESDKLLRTVQESFRQKLAASTESTDPISSDYTPSAHLSSVLKMAPFTPSPEEARQQREARIKRYLVDPISVFEEHVALGTATIDLARSCLARYNDAASTEKGGERVLKGLLKAGLLEMPQHFIRNTSLSYNLITALMREGKQGLLVKWTLTEDPASVKKFVHHVERTFGLERAAEVFFAFYDRLIEEKGVPTVLGVAGRELCKSAKRGGMSEEKFKRLMETSQFWALSQAENAMIQLRFGGNVAPGIEFFKKADQNPESFWAELPGKRRQKMTQLGIELAQACLAQEKVNEAIGISKIVSKRFADLLGGTVSASAEDRAEHDLHARGEAFEHLEVFKEMFKDILLKEKLAGTVV
ncbi:hypothetical protein BZA77DRAFT_314910 [Pyronema omphalodes]|nr:hypothetical protein BZA77DRAFT_314910 [Pyronema omphalodes]